MALTLGTELAVVPFGATSTVDGTKDGTREVTRDDTMVTE